DLGVPPSWLRSRTWVPPSAGDVSAFPNPLWSAMILFLLSMHVVSCKGHHIVPRLIRSSTFSRRAKSIPREGETEGAGERGRRSPSGICFSPDWGKVGTSSQQGPVGHAGILPYISLSQGAPD